jgi:hypothetical protein
MKWGQILIAYLIGSFFGLMQLLNMAKGLLGKGASATGL